MLSINGKKFMNISEAVQWLLNNNALPFQCTANYVADTVIAKSTIINPSPLEIKVGSLVLFADSKVGTVSGVTDSGFMVGQQYTDITDSLVMVQSLSLDASGHMIVTLTDGRTVDAGLVKQLSGMSIDASQHLIANYNDGTSTDLGAIFQGNVNISGNFTADSIIENMSGYSFDKTGLDANVTLDYAGVVKTGNKITFVQAGCIESPTPIAADSAIELGLFVIPDEIAVKLYDITGTNNLDVRKLLLYYVGSVGDSVDAFAWLSSYSYNRKAMLLRNPSALNANQKYAFRYECTFLLSDNLAA